MGSSKEQIGWCYPDNNLHDYIIYPPERYVDNYNAWRGYNKQGYMHCPSYQNFFSNTYVIKSPIQFTATSSKGEVKVESNQVDDHEMNRIVSYHSSNDMHDRDKPFFQMAFKYLFIADQPTLMDIMPPFNHSYPGQIIGGSFNIHSWVRNVSWGFQFNRTNDILKVERGDPLMYIRFTNSELKNNIKLVKCKLTEDIFKELDRKRDLGKFVKGKKFNFIATALKLRKQRLVYEE